MGASVSVKPKAVYDKLNFTHLTPTLMHLQLADSSVRYPEGIAEDVPVKVRDYFIPVDFVVLDMDISKDTPLILGRPFLSTAGHKSMLELEKSASISMARKKGSHFSPRLSNAL